MTNSPATGVLDEDGLTALVQILAAQGRTVIGPTVGDGAVVLAEIGSADDLPFGWGTEVGAGRYRLVPRADGAVFAQTAGPHSWKTFLRPQRENHWSAERAAGGRLSVTEADMEKPSCAFLGVRRPSRSRTVSWPAAGIRTGGTGSGERHPVDAQTDYAARAAVDAARDRMGREMPPVDLRTLMGESLDADRWDDVAARCLTCGNCTMVCPTCFWTTTEEVTDLTGDHAERWQRWDSCFDVDFSYLHGGPVRASARSRYRQWLTHRLSTWYEQFGSSGCVGCGRSVTCARSASTSPRKPRRCATNVPTACGARSRRRRNDDLHDHSLHGSSGRAPRRADAPRP
ncbi:4Fe-4S dicluster domain-containing protein [Streptomyces qaidamensis]|uniref:4Fe-4S dicluster domain-containing protein n=1 Tax=Streptomyces qaidamensis TaxID=1783515 RepID=UPI000ADCD19F